jgi:hypothetical protein
MDQNLVWARRMRAAREVAVQAKFNAFVHEAGVIFESLESGARNLWMREHAVNVRDEERARVLTGWNGKHYTRADFDGEVAKRVATRCERYVAARMYLLLHAMHVCNTQLLDDSDLALEDDATPVDPPRGPQLRLIRGGRA